METFKFDEEFMLGIASSSTQIEGADPNNTWYGWCSKQSRKNANICMHACGHWDRVGEDTELLKTLHVQTYRMSLEWSRIEPEEGVFSNQAIKHYREEIRLLLLNDIKPLVTLHHFSEPSWFQAQGGFEKPQNAELFVKYVKYVVEQLGDLVSDWVTFNEPNVYTAFGYLIGLFPPETRNIFKAYKVAVQLIKTHAKIYKLVHTVREENHFEGETSVGAAIHYRIFDGLTFPGRKIAAIIDHFFHRKFADGMAKHSDFMGVNYYTRNIVEFAFDPSNYFYKLAKDDDLKKSDIGWDIYPEGIYRICKDCCQRYHLPIYITENGVSDRHDLRRADFIADHLAYVAKAIREGIAIKRYYYWTLMDNFEWILGGAAKFGLYAMNAKTQDRAPRKSALLYGNICLHKELTKEMVEEFLTR